VFDTDPVAAERLAEELAEELGFEIRPTRDLSRSARVSDICVTCTPSRNFLLGLQDVAPGAFVAAVGADSREKQELDPRLLAAAKVVVDALDQCAEFGELHHALELGLVSRQRVHAELSDVVAGKKPGRESASEVIVFDSTGTALQDVAAAAVVYEKAVPAGIGSWVRLAG
jgi:ornithine cyclodeaminase/alanine dehydrogenase-like protein (mu-crystallin family)